MAEDPAAAAALVAKPKGESVKVVVKVRPLFGKEITEGRERIVEMDTKRSVAILHKPGGSDRDCKDFTFDHVFPEEANQTMIFEECALEIVDSTMEGFNGTIFCYGQTGAGKSFTMTGPENAPPDLQGLLPRSFRHIFSSVDTSSHNIKYLVRGSFLEIYNEDIRDLLSKNPKDRCELKDHPSGGVYVKDLSAFVVKTATEMDQVLQAGLSNRSTGATNMNAESSRSHSIFLVTIEQCEIGSDGEGHIRVGKLNMVDLAGSERQSKTGATGDRLKEATKINLSLSALGNVISALVDGKSSHIPYRDSKLTRLLQDSLGGNTKTVMVANIGPADYNYDETLSTLRYAYRAKSIKNKPRINEDPKDAMIREFQDEIMRLKEELARAGNGGGGGGGYVGPDGIPTGPGGSLVGPRIEKEIVTKEVEVEKIVEKEVIIEQGPTPEEVAAMEQNLRQRNEQVRLEAERKRREIEEQRDLAEAERARFMDEINREEQAAIAEQQRKNQLQNQLSQMEQKMVIGKQVMEKAIEQEEELKRQQREIRKQKKIEAKLKEQEEVQRQENQELEEKCATQEEQVQKLTSKLQKLWDKYQKAQQEMVDIQEFNQGEREDMLSMIRELRQTLKLKTLIMESFVPPKEVQAVQERGTWDPEEDEWVLQPVKIDKTNRPERPKSCFGLPRPTAEFTRLNHAMGDPNPRYMYDSIVITDLDLPERTTEDYETHPDLGERVERSLLLALSPEEDENSKQPRNKGDESGDDRSRKAPEGGSGRPITGSQKKRPTSGRPGTGRRDRHDAPPPEPAFPQARGLVSQE